MKNPKVKIRCAIYTRVSTDNQAEVEFNSCEAHKMLRFVLLLKARRIWSF